MGSWYLAVFTPASERSQAASVARAVWPDDPNGSDQLTIPLVDAQGAAWVGCSAAVTDVEIAALQGLAAIPSVRWYRYTIDPSGTGVLALAWDGSSGGAWDWDRCLAAAGLVYPPR